jgi:Ca2+-transporting ATPase
MNWHKSSIDQIFKHFNSTEEGISSDTVPERLQQHGYNQIEESRRKTHLDIFLDQFKDVMIVILMIVAVISGIVGEVTDTLIIILIIFMNAIIGFIQEYKADASIQAL